MANPNVLLLDEPTNDFDLATLSALEEYLVAFKGVLLVVSHDRAFLDKTVEFIYAFEDDGTIKQYPGNYTSYLHAMEQRTLEQRKTAADGKKESAAERAMQSATQPAKPRTGKGLSYKEQKELDEIGPKLDALTEEQAALEHELANSSGADHERLSRISTRLQEIAEENDTLTERWFALEEKKSAGV
jgi:ATP-binding cassette subfamily F protein uup